MANFRVNREDTRLEAEFDQNTSVGEILHFLESHRNTEIPQVQGKCLTACYRYFIRDDGNERCTASPVFQDDTLKTNDVPTTIKTKQYVHLIIRDPVTSSVVLHLGTNFSTSFTAHNNTLNVDLSKIDRLIDMLTAIDKIKVMAVCA